MLKTCQLCPHSGGRQAGTEGVLPQMEITPSVF